MRKFILIVVAVLSMAAWSGTAVAGGNPGHDNGNGKDNGNAYGHDKHHGDKDHGNKHSGYICADGTSVYVENVAAALRHDSHATSGKCVPPVVVPPVVIPPVVPAVVIPVDSPAVYLCWFSAPTTIGGVPGVVLGSEISKYLAPPLNAYAPVAVSASEAVKQGLVPNGPKWNVVGGYVLVCDTDGLHGTGAGLNGSTGDPLNKSEWADTLTRYGAQHPNHYEIYS